MRATWVNGLLAGVVVLGFQWTAGADTLFCRRTDSNDVVAGASAGVTAGTQNDTQNPDDDTDEILAYQFAAASKTSGDNSASANGEGEAWCPTAQQSTDSAPEVDVTATVDGEAASAAGAASAVAEASGSAITVFTVLQNGQQTTGTLFGGMYLVATGDPAADDAGQIYTKCDDSELYANHNQQTGNWDIIGWLDDGGDGEIIDESSPNGLNELYECSAPVQATDQVELEATIQLGVNMQVNQGASDSRYWGGSATSYFTVVAN